MSDSCFKNFRAGLATASVLLLAPAITTLLAAPSAFAQVLTAAQQTAAAGTYSIDKPHSTIAFTVTHLAITKVHGRFNEFDGTVKLDAKKVEASSVNFTIKVSSIDTSNTQRDTHLKSDAFFNAEKYPDITFKSTKIVKQGKGYAATGTLTMHGISKTVVLPFTATGPIKGMEGGQHVGVETGLTLKRSDYGITTYPGAVGDAIDITIELDLLKDGSVPPQPAAK